MKYLSISSFILMFLLSFKGPTKDSKQSAFYKSTDYNEHVTQTILNSGNFSTWIRYDGQSAHSPAGLSGGIYPRGTVPVIYQDGLIWGGFVDGDPNPKVGGQTYVVGTQAGHIISLNNPSNPADARIYRIRRDWQSLSIGDPGIIRDAAELNMTDIQSVTDQMQQDILDQYGFDWDNWPGNLGAPYYDINENGVWDNGIDQPGIANADQVIWFVINDLDEARVAALYGSDPIGLEVQITFWSYKGNVGDFGQAVFQKYKIINKSGLQIDSMFVSRWSDPDIGTYTDDLSACDTSLNMGYTYNGYAYDGDYGTFGLVPAAAGYKMLQGPLVAGVSGQDLNKNGIDDANDSGIFDMHYSEQGYINLPISSFYYFAAGSSIGDPTLGNIEGTTQWYNMLKGYLPGWGSEIPSPYITGSGPLQGTPTKFPLSGDPLTNTGDIDGQGDNLGPGDRRQGICTGPFTMLPGDTNEFVFALTGGIGDNYLASITDLKHNNQNLQSLHNDLYKSAFSYVNVTAKVEFETSAITNVRFEGINTYADDITLTLTSSTGFQIAQIQLYDDGTNGDNTADDGIWSYLWVTAPINIGLSVNANVALSGEIYSWDNLINSLTTRGPLRVTGILVGTDNLNFDGVINPGESVRYTVAIENQSASALSNLLVNQISFSHDPHIISISQAGAKYIPWINGFNSYSWAYDPQDVFYQFQVSNSHPGNDSVEIAFLINDNSNNKWLDTLSIFVAEALDTNVVFDLLAEHTNGSGFGQIGIRVVDREQLTGNLYEINFSESVSDQILYSVINATTAQTLLNNQPYPDQNAHNSTPVDGFVVTRGTTLPQQSVDWDFTGERWVSGYNLGLQLFFGGADLGKNFFFGSSLSDEQYFSVQLVFQDQAEVDANGYVSNGAVYRRDLSYDHAGTGQLPFAAYDISNPATPRRLNISFVEDINVGNANMLWDMGWDGFTFAASGGREYIFIHASDYNGGVDYNNSNFAPSADVVWAISSQQRGSRVYLEAPFTLNFYTLLPVGANDVFNFNSIITSIKTEEVPLSFELLQNYPNPFNPTTHIEFTIPELSEVKLVIYSILGQKVKTLVNQKLPGGLYSVSWNGDNNLGQKVSSGLYFYKIEAGDYSSVKKMMLLK